MSLAKRPSLRLTDCSDQIIETGQYKNRLDQLLNKIQTQNRYSNRISITNLLNLSRFEEARKELNQMKEVRKIEELNQVQLKNINSDLNKQIKELKQQLQLTSVSLLAAKKENKQQATKIRKLEQENIALQQQLLAKKRQDVQIITNFKMNIASNLLESEVKSFLVQVQWKDSWLIQYCRQCVFNEDYNDFFLKLENRIEQLRKEQKNNSICVRLSRANSRKRFNPSLTKDSNKTVVKPGYKQKEIRVHRRVKTLLPMPPSAIM